MSSLIFETDVPDCSLSCVVQFLKGLVMLALFGEAIGFLIVSDDSFSDYIMLISANRFVMTG